MPGAVLSSFIFSHVSLRPPFRLSDSLEFTELQKENCYPYCMAYCSERIPILNDQRGKEWGKVQEKPGTSFQMSLPSEVA